MPGTVRQRWKSSRNFQNSSRDQRNVCTSTVLHHRASKGSSEKELHRSPRKPTLRQSPESPLHKMLLPTGSHLKENLSDATPTDQRSLTSDLAPWNRPKQSVPRAARYSNRYRSLTTSGPNEGVTCSDQRPAEVLWLKSAWTPQV